MNHSIELPAREIGEEDLSMLQMSLLDELGVNVAESMHLGCDQASELIHATVLLHHVVSTLALADRKSDALLCFDENLAQWRQLFEIPDRSPLEKTMTVCQTKILEQLGIEAIECSDLGVDQASVLILKAAHALYEKKGICAIRRTRISEVM